jgi:DNA-binding response OmpR family regulator
MIADGEVPYRILIVEDVEETRDGMESLLKADGYRVDSARDEDDAVVKGTRARPDLVLVSLSGLVDSLIATGKRICERIQSRCTIPVVIFYGQTIPEGVEIEIDESLYLIRPDNFNQLRGFLGRLLSQLR